MATKFYGPIGYGEQVKTAPGVIEDVIVEYSYRGDVVRDSQRFNQADKINSDISPSNSISIIANPYAREHIDAMRYVLWRGVRWMITEVDVQPPRLILRLGGVYRGPTPVSSSDSP